MIGVKLAAQILVEASGWLSGDPDVALPLISRVQQSGDDVQRQIQELKRKIERQSLELKQIMRIHCIDMLIMQQDELARVRKALKAFEIVGPPTKIDDVFIQHSKSRQLDLEKNIKHHVEELLKLDPPSKLESK